MNESCRRCGEFPAQEDELCDHCSAYDEGLTGWRTYLDTFYRAGNSVATERVLLKVRKDKSRRARELAEQFKWMRAKEVIEEIAEIDEQLEIVAEA